MRVKKKPRVFIGLLETCDYTLRLAQGMRTLGYDVTHVVVINETISPYLQRSEKPDRYLNYHGSWVLLQVQLFFEFFRNFLTHDLFIFNFGEAFFSMGLNEKMNPVLYRFYSQFIDWKILKMLGKKIIVVTHGCDIRHYKLIEQWAIEQGNKYNCCMNCKDKNQCEPSIKQQRVKMIEKYADYIFSHPNAAQLFTRSYNHISLPINLSNIKFEIHNNQNPLMIHAPTSSEIKGTKYLLKAINKLKNKGYKFRFILIKNLPHEDLIKKLVEADIVIDQFLEKRGGISLFTIEGLATGNVVLSSFTPGYEGVPKDAPIVPTYPENIFDNLKFILENPKIRIELVKKGRKFVEKYHDYIKVTKKFLKEIGEMDQ